MMIAVTVLFSTACVKNEVSDEVKALRKKQIELAGIDVKKALAEAEEAKYAAIIKKYEAEKEAMDVKSKEAEVAKDILTFEQQSIAAKKAIATAALDLEAAVIGAQLTLRDKKEEAADKDAAVAISYLDKANDNLVKYNRDHGLMVGKDVDIIQKTNELTEAKYNLEVAKEKLAKGIYKHNFLENNLKVKLADSARAYEKLQAAEKALEAYKKAKEDPTQVVEQLAALDLELRDMFTDIQRSKMEWQKAVSAYDLADNVVADYKEDTSKYYNVLTEIKTLGDNIKTLQGNIATENNNLVGYRESLADYNAELTDLVDDSTTFFTEAKAAKATMDEKKAALEDAERALDVKLLAVRKAWDAVKVAGLFYGGGEVRPLVGAAKNNADSTTAEFKAWMDAKDAHTDATTAKNTAELAHTTAYNYYWSDAKAKADGAKTALVAKRTQIKIVNNNITTSNENIADYNAQIVQKNNEIAVKEDQKANWLDTYKAAKDSLPGAVKARDVLLVDKYKKKAHWEALDAAKTEKESLRQYLEAIKNDVNYGNQLLAQAQTDRDNAAADYNTAVDDLMDAYNDLNDMSKTDQTKANMEKQIRDAEKAVAEKEQEIATLQAESAKFKAQAEKWKKLYEEYVKKAEALLANS